MSKRFISALWGRGPTAPRPKPRTLLRVGDLEDRVVPTVTFQPSWAPTVNAFDPAAALKSPQVNLLFVGTYWTGTAGQADAAAITGDVKALLASPFLSKLTQYGSDGKATFGVAKTSPFSFGTNGTFTLDDMAAAVRQEVGIFQMPAPSAKLHPNIYIVVTDPNLTPWNPNYGGYNWSVPYSNWLFGSGTQQMIWARANLNYSGTVDRDSLSLGYSHEMAEKMASNVTLTPAANSPNAIIPSGSGRQISDFETDGGRYSYRVNGVLAQSYWSKDDGKYVVPDGSAMHMDVIPVWSTDAANNAYLDHFDLQVVGDQAGAGTADTVVVNAYNYAGRGMNVNLNGYQTVFDSYAIRNVKVMPGTGSNAVYVRGVQWGSSLTVAGTGTDSVIVGQNGSLAAIQGTVNVSNVSGKTGLTIDDSADPYAQTGTITSTAVTLGYKTITYGSGVSNVWLMLGTGGNSIDAQSTYVNTPVTVYLTANDSHSGDADSQVSWVYPRFAVGY